MLAQSTPKYSNEFLSIGVGARGLAMSNAQTAVVNDVTSGYWNPAGLLSIKDQYEVSLMHAEYFAGIAKYDYAAFATQIDSVSHLGISIIRFAVDDIPDTRFLYDANGAINYDNIQFFSAADYAFLFSYARKLSLIKGLKTGATFKVIHRIAGEFATAWGFGLDAGAQLERKNWKFGLMLRDITGTFNSWSHNTELVVDVYTQTGNIIPENSTEVTVPKAILGVGKQFSVFKNFGVLATLDLISTFDGQRNTVVSSDLISVDPAVAMELDYKKVAYLRLGMGNIQELTDFDGSNYTTMQANFGIGVKIKEISIDYALTDIGDQSESLYSHVFSLKASLNKK
nr:PorV/PorQ family protein [Fulvivirga sediminis]